MEVNISNLVSELNKIIHNHTQYDYRVVLYVLGVCEIFNNAIFENKLDHRVINLLDHLKRFINIPSNYLRYITENNKSVIISGYDHLFGYQDIWDSSSSTDIEDKINRIISHDKILLDRLVSGERVSEDLSEHDLQTKKLINKLFNTIDNNKDGYISAADTIHTLDMCQEFPLILEYNFICLIINLLVSNIRIDFDMFYTLVINDNF